MSNSASSLRLTSKSNPSLESQLAHDFMAQANVQPPLPQSSLSVPGSSGYFNGGGTGQGSLPTSPYGHPKGSAVALGVGLGRDYGRTEMLPSISSWNQPEAQGEINPMFRVVSGVLACWIWSRADRYSLRHLRGMRMVGRRHSLLSRLLPMSRIRVPTRSDKYA
jgi:hypothetical protein